MRDIDEERGLVRLSEDIEGPLPELTPGEKANGWTPEAIAAYRAERSNASMQVVDIHRRRTRPSVQNSKYSPFRWR